MILYETRQARHTLGRQLQSGEAALTANINALGANWRAQLAIIQQFEDKETVRNERTAALNAIRGAEEDWVVESGRHNDSQGTQGMAKQVLSEATRGQQGSEEPRHQDFEDHNSSVEELPSTGATGTRPHRHRGTQAPGPTNPGRADATFNSTPPPKRPKPRQHLQPSYLVGSIIELAPHTDSVQSIEVL